jgi:hypothetical protein
VSPVHLFWKTFSSLCLESFFHHCIAFPKGFDRMIDGRMIFCVLAVSAGLIFAIPARGAELPFAFLSERHPETTDTNGPYRIVVRQVLGSEISGGTLFYSAETSATGTQTNQGQVPLQSARVVKSWTGEIPGQLPGTTVHYHFLLTNQTGAIFRHPTRTPGRYVFRIEPIETLGVTLSNGPASQYSIRLRLRSSARPSGALVWRSLSSTNAPQERRISLITSTAVKETEKRRDRETATLADSSLRHSTDWVLTAQVPELQPGEIGDFFFEVSATPDQMIRIPTSAPTQVYSIKRPLRQVQPIASGNFFVTGLDAADRARWIGTQNGGLWLWQADQRARRWGLAQGLPSATAQFVVAQPNSRRAYVGTERGVFAIEGDGGLSLMLAGPYRPLPGSGPAGTEAATWNYRAGPAALSTLDGTLFFQLQREAEFEQRQGATKFLEWREGALREWRPGVAIGSLSAATFDEVDGCWLLGALIVREDNNVQPALLRRCGDQPDVLVMPVFPVGAHRAVPQRILAIARDPGANALVLAVEYTPVGDASRGSRYAVLRLEELSGRLAVLAPELGDVGVEITSLATDWTGRRILVGTRGRGILAVREGAVDPLVVAQPLPKEITMLKVTGAADTVLIGTAEGAFELNDSNAKLLSLPEEERLPADSQPMDFRPQPEIPNETEKSKDRETVSTVNGSAGKSPNEKQSPAGAPGLADSSVVLVSSYREGLAELERTRDGRWHAVRRLRPGQELPEGLFGEAKYTSDGEIAVIVHSQGLLRMPVRGGFTLLRTNDGLYSGHLLQLLVRRSGEIWLAHTPFPFGPNAGGALQMLRGNQVTHTVLLPNRDLATISQWVEVTERGTIFAATRAGVAEFADDGTASTLASDSVSAIARDSRTTALGVAGTTFLRWDGAKFSPVLFQVNHPRWPAGRFNPGIALDLAIDSQGVWYVLFQGGHLALLDAQGNYLGLLDSEDGVPTTARRLVIVRRTGEIFIGSTEGLVVVERAIAPREARRNNRDP